MQPQINPQPAPEKPAAGTSWERQAGSESIPPSRWPWVAGLLVAEALGGYLYWSRTQEVARRTQAASAGIRTFTVAAGGHIEKTLLLTGQTGPEKFSSLLTPQMRGSRSGRSSDGSSFRTSQRGGASSSGARGATTGSSSGGTSSGGGTLASNSAAASATGGGAAGGGAPGGGGMSAGMRSATSRVGGGSASGARSAASGRSSGGASGAMGADGMGSTSSNLPGGGGGGGGAPGGSGSSSGGMRGGGGGGSEFAMVLRDAAKPGSRVKKGDMVAEFDRQYMLTRLDDYRASVAQAEAAFSKLMAEIEVNKRAHDQSIANAKAAVDKAKLDMKTAPVLSEMDSERRKLALEEAEARLKQLQQEIRHVDTGQAADRRTAELDLQQTRLELKRAEMNADRMVMKAPIDGLVVMQNTFRGGEFDAIKVGDQLYPGMMFMQIVEPDSMVISATVNQADVQRLRIGQKASARFDAFPGLVLPAHVSAIGSVAKASRFRPDWVKEMPVILKLDKMDPRVIPDLSVACNVVLESADSAAIAPLDAIFRDEPEGKPYVFVRTARGDWQRREVEVGLSSNTQISVRSGVRAGDVLALDRPSAGGPAKPENVSSTPSPSRAELALPPGRRRLRAPL